MAYHYADDTFLPSWGSGMRPREPVDPEDTFTGFEDYPPKPKKLGTVPAHLEKQMDQLTPYGTMSEKVTEKVPMKIRRLDRVRVAEKSLFLLWWPAFLGVGITAAFGLMYWHHPTVAHSVFTFAIVAGMSMLVIAMNGGWHGKASMTFMAVNGFCIIFVALVGALLGLYCFETYTKSFEIYRASYAYKGILPNINPGAHRDAGTIEFAPGSHIEVDHSIGIKNGDTYCVAPITAPGKRGFSGFWAVGTNCCNAHGGFRCGDVANAQVRSGLVVLDENSFGNDEIPEYARAAEEAGAQFAIGVPDKPIFVKWSSDVASDIDQYYHDALGFVTSSAAGLFVTMLVFVSVLSAVGQSSSGFAHNYYSVEVYDLGDAEPCRRGRKPRKADRSADPFLSRP